MAKTKKMRDIYYQKFQSLNQGLQNLKMMLKTSKKKLRIFLELPSVKTFQDGKYTDEVRTVYEDLLCWGVGVENVEKVVRTVIQNLGGLQYGRLPKVTFAICVYLRQGVWPNSNWLMSFLMAGTLPIEHYKVMVPQSMAIAIVYLMLQWVMVRFWLRV